MTLQGWTDHRVEWLGTLWAKGRTCSEIAAEMGGITRNAVIGKVHRLGLNGRVYSQKKHSPEERLSARLRRQERRKDSRRAIKSFTPAPQRPLVCEEVTPRNLALMDLEPNDCRWPYGDGPFTFCGQPKLHGSYCSSHYFASLGPGTASERAANKVSTSLLVRE